MQKGIVISNISDLYHVEVENGKKYICNARGKLKGNNTSPMAGDKVEIEVISEEKSTGVILNLQERINETKRPKMANLTQLILVLSMKLPKPDLELLDKQLAYAEYMKIKPIIVLNKIDLVEPETVEQIKQIYEKIGYTVILTNAKENVRNRRNRKVFKRKYHSIFRKFRSAENQHSLILFSKKTSHKKG